MLYFGIEALAFITLGNSLRTCLVIVLNYLSYLITNCIQGDRSRFLNYLGDT